MAQWKSGPFDIVYDEKLNTNLRLLRVAAEMWAARGPDAPDADRVLAVLLRVFAARWSQFDRRDDREDKVRPLAAWLERVGTPERECAALAGDRPARHAGTALAELRLLLRRAALAWATSGYPEDPATHQVLHDAASILFRNRLLHRPPPSKIDECFGPA